jgi:protein-tyrosine phosphatase
MIYYTMDIIYLLLIISFFCLFYSASEHFSASHIVSKIDSHIYLSSYKMANNKKALKKYNIKNILTIMPDCQTCKKMQKYKNIKYMQVNKKDVKTENLQSEFEKTFKFIDDAVNAGENILIHCYAGISRSPTIIAAYLMKKYNMNRDNALKYLKNKRNIIKPNSGFMEQLKKYEGSEML